MERIRMNRASNLGPGNVRSDGVNPGSVAHDGHDIYAPSGTPVQTVYSGKVIATGEGTDYGKYITIEHYFPPSKDEFYNYMNTGKMPKPRVSGYSFYAHLSEFNIEENDLVSEGQEIGKTGTTGNADGATGYDQHLHFEYGTELRNEGSPFLKQTSLKNPNSVYNTTLFFSMDSEANQSTTGVIKVSFLPGEIVITYQNYNTPESCGEDIHYKLPFKIEPKK